MLGGRGLKGRRDSTKRLTSHHALEPPPADPLRRTSMPLPNPETEKELHLEGADSQWLGRQRMALEGAVIAFKDAAAALARKTSHDSNIVNSQRIQDGHGYMTNNQGDKIHQPRPPPPPPPPTSLSTARLAEPLLTWRRHSYSNEKFKEKGGTFAFRGAASEYKDSKNDVRQKKDINIIDNMKTSTNDLDVDYDDDDFDTSIEDDDGDDEDDGRLSLLGDEELWSTNKENTRRKPSQSQSEQELNSLSIDQRKNSLHKKLVDNSIQLIALERQASWNPPARGSHGDDEMTLRSRHGQRHQNDQNSSDISFSTIDTNRGFNTSSNDLRPEGTNPLGSIRQQRGRMKSISKSVNDILSLSKNVDKIKEQANQQSDLEYQREAIKQRSNQHRVSLPHSQSNPLETTDRATIVDDSGNQPPSLRHPRLSKDLSHFNRRITDVDICNGAGTSNRIQLAPLSFRNRSLLSPVPSSASEDIRKAGLAHIAANPDSLIKPKLDPIRHAPRRISNASSLRQIIDDGTLFRDAPSNDATQLRHVVNQNKTTLRQTPPFDNSLGVAHHVLTATEIMKDNSRVERKGSRSNNTGTPNKLNNQEHNKSYTPSFASKKSRRLGEKDENSDSSRSSSTKSKTNSESRKENATATDSRTNWEELTKYLGGMRTKYEQQRTKVNR